ncbi:MAG TPA: 6-bladed beta-propeller [Sedimenticola sp.]|nr:6-bladed beta-propeller [Sedimenticola sp.]
MPMNYSDCRALLHGWRWGIMALAVGILGLAGCDTAPKKPKKEPVDIVWPAPPEQPRIRYLASYRGQVDFAVTDDLRAKLFGIEVQGIHLAKPYGVAVNPDGSKMYVTDAKVGGVVVFDFKKKKVSMMPTDAMGAVRSPVEVRVDSRGRVYVTDGFGHKLNVYAPNGKTLFSIGGAQRIKRPTGLALDEARNQLYVSDTPNHRVLTYDLNGNFIREIGGRGNDPGKFNFPINLAVDKNNGRLYVTDSGNFRIQAFSPEGEYVTEFGQIGDSFGSFARPKGVGVDSEGHIYVLDAAFSNLQIFNDEGRLLLFVGALGRGPGFFWLPAGIYIDSRDRIYVADSINQRIQVFQYLKEGEGISQKSKQDMH